MRNWRKSREYRLWRVAVIRRDKRCRVCGSIKKRQAHHVKDASNHPEHRFDVDNGVTLCYGCHKAFHTMFKRNYRRVCDDVDYGNFEDLIKYVRSLCAADAVKMWGTAPEEKKC